MNYIQQIILRLNLILEIPKEYDELLGYYAQLVLTVGEDCTKENIHDAWSAWQNTRNSFHQSLIPFEDLTKKVQDLDIEYRDAVISIAKRLQD